MSVQDLAEVAREPRAGRLQDKVIVITGASSGIGRATMEIAGREGAKVVGTARTESKLQEGLDTVKAARRRGHHRARRTSRTRPPGQGRGRRRSTRSGRIDVLVANAGVGWQYGIDNPGTMAGVHEASLENWRAIIGGVDLEGYFLAIHAVLPHMLERGSGSIVNVGSMAGVTGLYDAHAYTAAKGAIINLTRSMAITYAKQGVRTNCVCPGFIDTPMIAPVVGRVRRSGDGRGAVPDGPRRAARRRWPTRSSSSPRTSRATATARSCWPTAAAPRGRSRAERPARARCPRRRARPTVGMHANARDDIVRTFEEAAGNDRPPLLVTEPLERFLDERGLGAGPVEAFPVGEGHSNVTYVIVRDGWEGVIRRPPRPPLPPSAHDVGREARVLRAVRGTARVPEVLAVCEDASVIGAPFFVMSRIEGHVVTREMPPALDDVADRRRMGEELIDALVEIHAVDWQAAGLEGFGRPTGYLERQVRRFGGLWEHHRTREIPAVEQVAAWLGDHVPESGPATVVHGDYRLGNVMFAPAAPARIVAVLDWEMATIGDPLADLGYLTAVWCARDDPSLGRFELSPVTRGEGFSSRAELVARYEERSGRAMTDMRWYQTLALWKAAIFMEGNYRRAVTGATDDPYLKGFGESVLDLAEHAREIALGS